MFFSTGQPESRPNNSPLFERYRPRSWNEVIGQEKTVQRIRLLAERGSLSGRAYWISGQSGTGKTTIARLLAAEVADEFFLEEIDAGDCTVAKLKDLESTSQVYAAGQKKNGRAFIVNEAHGLRKDAIRQLLVLLERIPSHVCWIFTTTSENQEALFEDCLDASPLLSRCIRLELSRRDLTTAFAQRAKEIAQREGLDGVPIEKYIRRAKDRRNNMRSLLCDVEAGEMLA